jgi:hypothetical protein
MMRERCEEGREITKVSRRRGENGEGKSRKTKKVFFFFFLSGNYFIVSEVFYGHGVGLESGQGFFERRYGKTRMTIDQ